MQPNAVLMSMALALFAAPATGADLAEELLGVWRLTSVTHTVLETGEVKQPFGERPTGVAIFSYGGSLKRRPLAAVATRSKATKFSCVTNMRQTRSGLARKAYRPCVSTKTS